jgi:hypothetical protein
VVLGVLVLLTALFYGLLARYNYTVHPKNGTIGCFLGAKVVHSS